MSKVELVLRDSHCDYCGTILNERNGAAYCEECRSDCCESCAVQKKYCPACWDDDEDGPRKV